MRHKKVGVGVAVLVVLLSAVLGGTVLREPIAYAATPFTNVVVGNTSANPVPVTVGNLPAVQDVAVQAPELWSRSFDLSGTDRAIGWCVPGKQFVVQSISAHATTPVGTHVQVIMRDGDSGFDLPLQIVPGPSVYGGSGSDWVGAVTGPVLAKSGCMGIWVRGTASVLSGWVNGYMLPA